VLNSFTDQTSRALMMAVLTTLRKGHYREITVY